LLKLESEFIDRIREHARHSYPEECCGFLFGYSDGEVKHVSDLHELTNSSGDNRSRRYVITPEEYRTAEIWAEGKGLEVLGLYHSHPDHPSRPSQFDIDHALPWWSYIIIAVDKGIPSVISSWILNDDRTGFGEESIEQVKKPAPSPGIYSGVAKTD
jgi:proteasome lid subunit RPN8/RPN11